MRTQECGVKKNKKHLGVLWVELESFYTDTTLMMTNGQSSHFTLPTLLFLTIRQEKKKKALHAYTGSNF